MSHIILNILYININLGCYLYLTIGVKLINTITLGAGCFWCVEAVFMSIPGVDAVEVGYCNGGVQNPTYEMVCTGNTGHAEVAKITYNSNIISLEQILNHFFKTHDPTTLNKQGADAGTQYRSAIFYNSNNQREVALQVIEKWEKSNYYDNPIVTEVTQIDNYSKAEDYHQNYYQNNKSAPYCMFVIKPKLDKIGE